MTAMHATAILFMDASLRPEAGGKSIEPCQAARLIDLVFLIVVVVIAH
jgi:hypothetical protein